MSLQESYSIFRQSRPEIPPGLSKRIAEAVDREVNRRLQFRSRLVSGFTWISLVLSLTSLIFFGGGLIASDFWQLASLLFSDLPLVLTNFEAFALSLAETFPAGSAILLLLPLFVYLVMLTFRSRYVSGPLMQSSLRFNPTH